MDTKVLVVDDEPSFVRALSKRLAKRGFSLTTAGSGPMALEKLKADPKIDVVILDVRMPGMDGIETLKAIKSLYPLVEVIILTAYSSVESGIEGMKLGALDYVTKPCDLGILEKNIEDARAKRTKALGEDAKGP